MEIKINNENFEEEVLKSTIPVLVDIYSETCSPCKVLYKMLLELSSEHEGKFKFCTANMEDNSILISKFTVYSVPTILFFKNRGMMLKRIGLRTKESLSKDVEETLLCI